MEYNYIKQDLYLSKSRLSKYIAASEKDRKKAIKLYRANTALSESLYTLLSNFEIIFRNTINERLKSHLKDNRWLINQRNGSGYMKNATIQTINSRSGKKEKSVHEKTINKIIKKLDPKNHRVILSSPSIQGQIVSNLMFGFWTEFFHPNYYSAVNGQNALDPMFNNLPSTIFRKDIRRRVYGRLTRIRLLRNRIAHHEPICFAKSSNNFDLQNVKTVHKEIYDILNWIDPDLSEWVNKIDTVQYNIEKIELCSQNRSLIEHKLRLRIIKLKHFKYNSLPN